MFLNVVVVNPNFNTQTLMGGMTMNPSDAAAFWNLSSLVTMCLEEKKIAEAAMLDLGLGRTPVKECLPDAKLAEECT